ncbi:MAG: Ig-like domain repeat protein, partial [Candidatus Aerophobetes bacterium]|nr:Ig-like domain repeat protein [Candidatus Aerophobetes bacterium]
IATETRIYNDAYAQDGGFDGPDELWGWDATGVDWKDGMEHFVYSRAYDAAGNISSPVEKRIIYDTAEGVSAVTYPAGVGQNYNIMDLLQGTASDDQGVDYVEISVFDGTNYLDKNAWTFISGAEEWVKCSGTTTWSRDSSTMPFSPGITYTVKSRMTDKAGNVEATGAKTGVSFVYDTGDPTSYVQYPEEGAYAKVNDSTSAFTIYGTASDSYSDISQVELVIKKGNFGGYWDGSGWDTDNIQWVPAQWLGSSWTYTGVDLADGLDHKIWIKASDDVLPTANTQPVDDSAGGDIDLGNNYSAMFKYDITEPDSVISYPADDLAYNVNIETFTGTYTDPNNGSGVSQIKLRVRRALDNCYWMGEGSWWGSAVSHNATLPGGGDFEWYISNLSEFYPAGGQEKYYIYTKAEDAAGNYEDTQSDWTVVRSTYIYDIIEPEVAVSTPSHLSHYNALSEIGGTSADGFSGVDYVELRISSGAYTWAGSSWSSNSNWLSVTGDTAWKYTSLATDTWKDGNFYKTEARVLDRAGNDAPAVSTFTFDITRPTATITTPDSTEPEYTSGSLPSNFDGTAYDLAPGEVDSVKVALYNATIGKWWDGNSWITSGSPIWFATASGADSWSWPVNVGWEKPEENQRHIFYAVAADKAGNVQLDGDAAEAAFWFQGDLPITAVNRPDEGKYYNVDGAGLSAIEGTSIYADSVEIRIQQKSDSLCWDQDAKVWKSSGTFQWNVRTGLEKTGDSWALTVATYAWTSGQDYLVTSRGWSIQMSAYEADWGIKAETNRNFTMDMTLPSAQVSSPVDGSYRRLVEEVEGTASDAHAGVNRAEVSVRDNVTNYYWDGADGAWDVSGSVVFSTTVYSAGAWSLENVPSWEHGRSYRIQPRVYDNANDGIGSNLFSGSVINFTYDIVAPTAAVNVPADSSFPSQLAQISGTAVDDFILDRVNLQIINRDTTNYWDGGWYASERWPLASGTTDWYYDNVPSWSNDVPYTVKVMALDKAGSTSTIKEVNFRFDDTAPDSGITQPNPAVGYVSDIIAVGGTANDAVAGLPADTVLNQIVNLTASVNPYYIGGGAWDSSPSWQPTSGAAVSGGQTQNWSANYLIPDFESGNLYRFISKVSSDTATPPLAEAAPYQFEVVYDTVNPVSRVTYPADGSPEKAVSSLKGTAWDDWSSVGSYNYQGEADWSNYPLELEVTALANGAAGWGEDKYWTGTEWSTNTASVFPNVYLSSWTYNF